MDSRKAQLSTVGPVPLTITRSLPSGDASARRQTKRGAHKSRRPVDPPGPSLSGTDISPPQRETAVIDMTSSESSGGEDGLARLAAPTSTPSLTAPIPSLTGGGGHIFPIPRPPNGLDSSTDAVAVTSYPDFDRYRHLLQYRGPHGSNNAVIFHPAEGDIGDKDGWYYVTVGRNVGVFNAW